MSDVTNVKVAEDNERWEITVTGEITSEALARFRLHVLKDMRKDADIKGFRKGHVPEEALVRHVGEAAILQATAEHAIHHVLPEIIAKEKVQIVDSPQVTLDKPVAGKSLPFTARAPRAPHVTLPDYEKIARDLNAKREAVSVSEDEHKETLVHLRRERARIDKIELGIEHQQAAKEAHAMNEKDLPPLDDAFVKTIGYDTADVFTEKLREHLKNEKELRAKSEHRARILDALEKEATIHMPIALLDYELDDMEARFSDDLQRMGKTFEQYLAETKKTRDGIRTEWNDAAKKRAHIRLILSRVAQKENIEPDEALVLRELDRAQKQYPQSQPGVLRSHIAHALRNEAVLDWLEARV